MIRKILTFCLVVHISLLTPNQSKAILPLILPAMEVIGFGLSVYSAFDDDLGKTASKQIEDIVQRQIKSVNATPPPKPTNDRSTYNIYTEISGLLNQVVAERTCEVSPQYLRNNRTDLGIMTDAIIEGCETSEQRIITDEIINKIHTTIPKHQVNSKLFQDLFDILKETNFFKGGRIREKFFLIHRSDGEDGLTGVNPFNFKAVPITSAPKKNKKRKSFTTIPINGDKTSNIKALSTEICQTELLDEALTTAETLCNSFGLAAKTALIGYSYKEYTSISKEHYFIFASIEDILKARTLSRKVYEKLKNVLRGQPDILERQ